MATREEIGRILVSHHKPFAPNYRAKFGLGEEPQKQPCRTYRTKSTKDPKANKACPKCNSKQIEIRYGKYGYYYKCLECSNNTGINLPDCPKGHKTRLRKKRQFFYVDCSQCETSTFFFRNPSPAKDR